MKTIKVGSHRGTGRLWLEGKWLASAHFTKGQRFTLIVNGASATLALTAEGTRQVSGKTKGDSIIPVIDINAAEISHLIGTVTVAVADGIITIAKAEQQQTIAA